MLSQVKTFSIGAVLGAVVGATVLASIAHLLLIGLAVLGSGVLMRRGLRRLRARPDGEERRLKA
jgi:uncharacterized membrane protein YfcA